MHEDVYKDAHEEDLGEGLLLPKKKFMKKFLHVEI
jgi:hypothetical protein